MSVVLEETCLGQGNEKDAKQRWKTKEEKAFISDEPGTRHSRCLEVIYLNSRLDNLDIHVGGEWKLCKSHQIRKSLPCAVIEQGRL